MFEGGIEDFTGIVSIGRTKQEESYPAKSSFSPWRSVSSLCPLLGLCSSDLSARKLQKNKVISVGISERYRFSGYGASLS